MNHNDEFDHVLDEALAEYRDVEPLAGLEHRVLQRVRRQAEHRRKIWMRWSALAACAAMLAITAWIGLRDRVRHDNVPTRPITAHGKPPIAPQPKNAGTQKAEHRPNPRAAAPATLASANHAPVRSQFPLPAPLNPEERALLVLAQTHPEVLIHLPSTQEDHAIAIAPINIRPLANEAGANQGEN
jgi:hypothetical protein